jgi:hypothetical protein
MVSLPDKTLGLLRDCLMGLPSLHTLGIANGSGTPEWDAFSSISRCKLDFPNIKKVAIPLFAHPILGLLPQVEELVCFCDSTKGQSIRPILERLRKPYVKERKGQIDPVLKSLTIVSPARVWGCGKCAYIITSSPSLKVTNMRIRVVLIEKYPRLRKLCQPEVNYPSPPRPSHPR